MEEEIKPPVFEPTDSEQNIVNRAEINYEGEAPEERDQEERQEYAAEENALSEENVSAYKDICRKISLI